MFGKERSLCHLNAVLLFWATGIRPSDLRLLDTYEARLHATEKDWLSRITHAKRRRMYIAGHVLARVALSKIALNEIDRNEICHPANSWPRSQSHEGLMLDFNISHSGDWVAVLAAEKNTVGLDIEVHKDGRDFLSIAQYYFAPDEYVDLVALSERELAQAFYRLWCLKECAIKLDRLGISESRLRAKFEPSPEQVIGPNFFSFIYQDFSGALGVRQPVSSIDSYLFEPETGLHKVGVSFSGCYVSTVNKDRPG